MLECSIIVLVSYLFHDGGSYYTLETSPLIYINQWTGFYMIGASVMKELIVNFHFIQHINPMQNKIWEVYLKPCQTSMMKRLKKQLTTKGR